MVKLNDLINRGDVISITNGQLNIIPKSGRPVPDSWLYSNQGYLLKQICDVVQQPIYQFLNFTVGRYSNRFDGLTMSFIDLHTHEDYFTIFNVSLNRKTRHGRLTGKRFNPAAKGALLKFWNLSNLPKPRRPSELYKKINIMKNYVWQAEVSEGSKLYTQTLCLANITHEQILEAFSCGISVANRGLGGGILAASTCGSSREQSEVASRSGKESFNNHTWQGVAEDQTTCIDSYGHNKPRALTTTGSNNYDISNQGDAVRGNTFPPIASLKEGKKAKPQDQTNAEWLADYGELDT
ncbi:hypothetical protein QL995_04455 [Pseudoalteromonas sp. APC 3358]|uniref:hypothetical protein n=1 Tax=Pseudoalteromonas sp. APC 3358 TaxID=3035176 RepID=UPI0025B4E75B|nr:hypothetical protein [Pseudoalteromonas sp. APC 3358]MDN3381934.1 hypothetical protein [Pseudoalteromonas sp. APC 3358]